MTLPPSRSPAWSRSRQSLRRALLLARPARRSNSGLMRQPTALAEKDDPLNQAPTEQDILKAKPRWSYTPPALERTYGFRLKEAKNPENSVWQVNEDPAKLDEFYERFLGRNGARMLPEELKWLAVTHKSFDYGRRGFNTKLAFFGRQIFVLEVMKSIMAQSANAVPYLRDPWRREHFRSPALANVDKLSERRPADYISIRRLSQVGFHVQLDQVMRWKPRMTNDLAASGIDMVLATTLFAIVGAVSLQRGGQFASATVREKMMGRMRLETEDGHSI